MVTGKVDGKYFPVAFKDMDVEMPILSMRKLVKRQNVVRFTEGGGTIKNKKTNKVIKFYEYEGVYFAKLAVDDPGISGMPVSITRPPCGR